MTGVKTFPSANLFFIDEVTIALAPEKFSNKEIIHILRNKDQSRNEDQFILAYQGVRATVSEMEAQKLNKDLGIKII